MSICPCGSQLPFESCCRPLIAGEHSAATAEALMRSRYTAYVVGAVDYLHDTLHPDYRSDHDREATRRWAAESAWLGLQIVSTEQGGEEDQVGVVEFIASYKEKGMARRYHELSRFLRVDGNWFYVDGEVQRPGTVVNEKGKVGRNDPCPCGSGKKYKYCCGR